MRPKVKKNGHSAAQTALKLKRYNLVLPEGLYDEVRIIADQRGATVVELLRRFIKLGLLAVRVEENPDAALILREGQTEREIMLL